MVITDKKGEEVIWPADLDEHTAKVEASRNVAIDDKSSQLYHALQEVYEYRIFHPMQRIADIRFRRTGVLQPFGARVPGDYVLNP